MSYKRFPLYPKGEYLKRGEGGGVRALHSRLVHLDGPPAWKAEAHLSLLAQNIHEQIFMEFIIHNSVAVIFCGTS